VLEGEEEEGKEGATFDGFQVPRLHSTGVMVSIDLCRENLNAGSWLSRES